MLAQPFTVLVDPRLAEEGLTAADLVEQFNHNVKVRELTTATNAAVARARELQAKFKDDPVRLRQVEEISSTLLTQPVRYGKPGLQAHVQYLAGMTSSVDQKVGRDALERYAVLKKELDSLVAVLDKIK